MTKIHFEAETRIVVMYKKGKSMQKIAQELSVSTGTVFSHLKKYIPQEERKERQHKRASTPDATNAKAFKSLYLHGLSTIQIAKKFNTTSGIVRYALKKQGVDTSKNGKYKNKLKEADLEKIRELYEKTGSILETAKIFGLYPSSVHNRLRQFGIVKKKTINQKIAKQKYEMLTEILLQLFNKMDFQVEHVQQIYNGHGPDMIVQKDNYRIVIEHKATIKRSFYWQHAVEEARENLAKHNCSKAWVITTASKPHNFTDNFDVRITFLDELKNLLINHKLESLLGKVDFISNTPCI
ncbi:restriction endonuclease [Candidatus Woesearchaeota archaeon]|nr:restriction endonuclease [Candidatus Woesearchaeota archaeon]